MRYPTSTEKSHTVGYRKKVTHGPVWFDPALRGVWPFSDVPEEIELRGRVFVLWAGPVHGPVVAEYREDKPTYSLHLYVLRNKTYVITHADHFNPVDYPAQHVLTDVLGLDPRLIKLLPTVLGIVLPRFLG